MPKRNPPRQEDELGKVRQDHRYHAPHEGVEHDDDEHGDHDDVHILLVQAGEPDDELAAQDREESHVQGAGEGEDTPTQQAHTARVFDLVELGHGHDLQVA